MESKAFSMSGWDIWTFVKGRKKMVIALAGAVAGFALSDSAAGAVVGGAVVECAFSIIEFYVKKVELK